jgi:hypothetical protein
VQVTPGGRLQVAVKLDKGGTVTFKSNVEARLLLDGKVIGKVPGDVPLGEGAHTILVRASKPLVYHLINVDVGAAGALERDLAFGFVDITAAGVIGRPVGIPVDGARAVALPAGDADLELIHQESGEHRVQPVSLKPGQHITIDKW